MTVVLTLGHADRSLDELLALLVRHQVTALIDVRAQPHSVQHPQFDEDSLRPATVAKDIIYHWAGRQLGEQRQANANSPHVALPECLRGYADYMETGDFARAAAQLMNMASREVIAILCAEPEPSDCHCGLIADYLLLQSVQVQHIIDTDTLREHPLSVQARRESARLVYDRDVVVSADHNLLN